MLTVSEDSLRPPKAAGGAAPQFVQMVTESGEMPPPLCPVDTVAEQAAATGDGVGFRVPYRYRLPSRMRQPTACLYLAPGPWSPGSGGILDVLCRRACSDAIFARRRRQVDQSRIENGEIIRVVKRNASGSPCARTKRRRPQPVIHRCLQTRGGKCLQIGPSGCCQSVMARAKASIWMLWMADANSLTPNRYAGDKLMPFRISSILSTIWRSAPPSLSGLPRAFRITVTFLKCGGVTVGTGMHHVTMDGAGAFQFIRAWTALARGEAPPAPPPFHDRTLLRARSPPRVPFEHPVYSPCYLNGAPRPFATRVYAVPPKLLAGIRAQCAPGASTYCAVTAHLWRAMCVARGLPPDADTRLRVPANVRQRLRPPLPAAYFGNAIVRDLVTVRVGDVLSRPLGFVAERIKRAVSRVDDAFVRSVVDYVMPWCGGDFRRVRLGSELCCFAWFMVPYNPAGPLYLTRQNSRHFLAQLAALLHGSPLHSRSAASVKMPKRCLNLSETSTSKNCHRLAGCRRFNLRAPTLSAEPDGFIGVAPAGSGSSLGLPERSPKPRSPSPLVEKSWDPVGSLAAVMIQKEIVKTYVADPRGFGGVQAWHYGKGRHYAKYKPMLMVPGGSGTSATLLMLALVTVFSSTTRQRVDRA
ncbi:hypothetical protein C2845_PM04G12800 [Panicum miliaceum]|uniref:Shikimate O-hydroxycinnamoyltransferase-like n=1 Tax=Panicum miliaceum TaxID=4540 RepID=A0A3L6QU68_PANMI|nr:hypothetical protein C2845_PM04G12800 [Panicum miliaceum]